MLCEGGADVNHPCHEQTPLHGAIGRADYDIEIVRVLLNHGGDANKLVEERGTPVRASFPPKPLKSSLNPGEIMSTPPPQYKVVSNITEAVHCY